MGSSSLKIQLPNAGNYKLLLEFLSVPEMDIGDTFYRSDGLGDYVETTTFKHRSRENHDRAVNI